MTTDRIEIDPAVMMGKPVIRGTRITVELILRKLTEGASQGELLEDYPHLTGEDILAAVAYGQRPRQAIADIARQSEEMGLYEKFIPPDE